MKAKLKNIDQKKKTLFTNTIMLYILTFSSYIFNLITVPYQTRVLGPEVYGNLGFAMSFAIYFQLLFDFGFILSATKVVAENRDDKRELGRILSAVNILKLIFIGISAILLLILCVTVERLKTDPLLFVLVFIYVAINSFLPDFLYRGIENMKIITYRSVAIRFLFTILVFVFLKNKGQYYVVPILNIIGAIVAIVAVYTHIRFKLKIKMQKVKKAFIFKTFMDSGLYFLSRIATTIYSSTNTFILGFLYPSGATVGYYSASNKLISTGQTALSPISDSIFPYMVKNKDFKLVKKMLLFVEPLIIITCIAVAVFAEPLCIAFFGDEYAESATLLRLTLPIIVVTLPNYLLGFPTMTALGIAKQANYSVIAAAVWHILSLLILFLTNNLNVYGICICASITEIVLLVIRITFIIKAKQKNTIPHTL